MFSILACAAAAQAPRPARGMGQALPGLLAGQELL